MKKIISATIGILVSYFGMAQDPAVSGILVQEPISPRINEYTRLEADFFNGSSSPFSPANTVFWRINVPATLEYDGNYSFEDSSIANFVNVTWTPYDAANGQIITITSKPGIAFPGSGGGIIYPWVKGKMSGLRIITLRAYSNPLVGTNLQINDFATTPVVVQATVLPVTLTDFAANKSADKKSARLGWRTATEMGTDHYEVERSADGIKFEKLGTVKAVGTTTQPQYYDFPDAAVLNGKNYYRLKIVDADGKVKYSGVQILDFGKSASIIVYPNPVKDKAVVSGVEPGMTLLLLNEHGQTLRRQAVVGNTVDVPMAALPAGPYHIQLLAKDGSLASTTKLVKE